MTREHHASVWADFCRVIDNHGDLGVCWRLATQLSARGLAVHIYVDDASALRWMAPSGCTGVTVLPWPADDEVFTAAEIPGVVIEPLSLHPATVAVAAGQVAQTVVGADQHPALAGRHQL